MAGNATANRVALRYVLETTSGQTPANPVFQDIRYTGETLNFNRTAVESKEIRDDRNTADIIPVKGSSGGDANFEFSAITYDDFLEALLCGTWSAPVNGVSTLKNGVTDRSFSIQKHFQDMTPNVYNTFVGQRLNDMTMDFKVGAIVTGKFGFMGRDVTSTNTQISGASSNPVGVTSPMNAVSNITEIDQDGAPSVFAYKSLSLNVNNNCREQEAIAHMFPIDIVTGKLDVSGNIEAYFSTLDLYNKFLNDTALALSFKMMDAKGNYYVFTMPKVKLETPKIESGGIDTDIMMTGSWKAIYDSTSDCMIQIDRFLAP